MLLNPRQIRWLQSPKGKLWLETAAGQKWLAENKDKIFLDFVPKEKTRPNQEDQIWSRNSPGYFWLKALGNKWLETQPGQEWLTSSHGQTWLRTTGRKWLNSHQGQLWLEVPAE